MAQMHGQGKSEWEREREREETLDKNQTDKRNVNKQKLCKLQ